MPLISIIVPIYNAENYLHRCVDSILSQTLLDIEILLINDGSSDRSANICNEYARIDNRIRVFHNNNQGVSRTRQFGINHALGEYTIHVDSDDWVEPNMLEILYNEAIMHRADIVICDFYIDLKKYTRIVKQEPSSLHHYDVLRDLFNYLHGSLCNKLIKRSCYTEYSILFPMDMSLCEDLYVICSILKHDIKISYVPQPFYHYVQNENEHSITKIVNSSYDYDLFLLERFSNLLNNETCVEDCRNKFVFDLVQRSFERKNFTSLQFKKLFYKYRKIIISKHNKSLYIRMKLYLSCIGFYFLFLYIDIIKVKIK